MPIARNDKKDVFKFIDMHNGDASVCWEWKRDTKGGGKDNRPYFQYEGKKRLAYRIVMELFLGRELAKEEIIRHKCDNPRCCNPHHHIIGDHQENMNDMKERERHGTPKTVRRSIRKLAEGGITHKEIAERWGLTREAVTAIVNSEEE